MIDDYAALIARRAVFGPPSTGILIKSADIIPQGVKDTVGGWAKNLGMEQLGKMWNENAPLRYGVYGAGAGAGLGLLSGILGKKKRPLSSMLTGGLLGGLAGGGGKYVYDKVFAPGNHAARETPGTYRGSASDSTSAKPGLKEDLEKSPVGGYSRPDRPGVEVATANRLRGAKTFATRYKERTGKEISPDQAIEMANKEWTPEMAPYLSADEHAKLIANRDWLNQATEANSGLYGTKNQPISLRRGISALEGGLVGAAGPLQVVTTPGRAAWHGLTRGQAPDNSETTLFKRLLTAPGAEKTPGYNETLEELEKRLGMQPKTLQPSALTPKQIKDLLDNPTSSAAPVAQLASTQVGGPHAPSPAGSASAATAPSTINPRLIDQMKSRATKFVEEDKRPTFKKWRPNMGLGKRTALGAALGYGLGSLRGAPVSESVGRSIFGIKDEMPPGLPDSIYNETVPGQEPSTEPLIPRKRSAS